MTFFPIVERELRSAARRPSTHWLRLGAAFVGLIVGGWIMLIPDLRRPSVLGIVLFCAMSITAFVYGLLAGMFSTADSLSEEKRNGTLGLLFLTDLKGYDIVFGKIAATSLNIIYGMLALFPIMAIPLLAGGVTGAEFWRVVMVALNNLFFSLAVGMFCSSISHDERRGMVLTFSLVLAFAVLLPVAGMAWYWNDSPHRFRPWLFVPSPGYACFFAFDDTWRSLPNYNRFYPSVFCVHAISWTLLLLSCYVVPRTWQDRAATSAQLRRRSRWHWLSLGSIQARAALRTRLLEINPYYWLVARGRFKLAVVWMVFAVVGLFWIWGLTFHPRAWKDTTTYLLTALLLHTVFKLWLASEACRHFVADRKSGALELLLSTPIPVKEILRGQILALEKQFALPMLVLLVMDFVFLMANRRESTWVMVYVAGMTVLIADLVTLSWVGMWRGLNSRSSNRAFAAAVALILVLPWVLFGLAMTAIVMIDHLGRLNLDSWWYEAGSIWIWLGLSLGIDALFGLFAWRILPKEFRLVATENIETKRAGRRRKVR